MAPKRRNDGGGANSRNPKRNKTERPDLREFDHDEEIRHANAMGFGMLQGSFHTPAPMVNNQPVIKKEREDSTFTTHPTGFAAIPEPESGAHSFLPEHEAEHALTLPPRIPKIEAELRTFANILKDHGLTHTLFQPALENIKNICLASHAAQIQ